MNLSGDQRLWLLTAHPCTQELGKARAGTVVECIRKGLVSVGPRAGSWRLSPRGERVWRELREGDAPPGRDAR